MTIVERGRDNMREASLATLCLVMVNDQHQCNGVHLYPWFRSDYEVCSNWWLSTIGGWLNWHFFLKLRVLFGVIMSRSEHSVHLWSILVKAIHPWDSTLIPNPVLRARGTSQKFLHASVKEQNLYYTEGRQARAFFVSSRHHWALEKDQ